MISSIFLNYEIIPQSSVFNEFLISFWILIEGRKPLFNNAFDAFFFNGYMASDIW